MQKLNQEIPKETTEKAKMSDVKCLDFIGGNMSKLVSVALLRVSASVIMRIR